MTLVPIVLFVYNRPWHTRQSVEALQKNTLAIDSELFVYSDNAKDNKVQDGVDEVRKYIKTIEGFKNITIIEQKKNIGLANSIIKGVTEVVNKYGKVIVLEDDLVTSPYFLKFMNEALNFYENEKSVWHVAGWNYPVNIDGLDDVFLWRFMNCWGWATWSDRWYYYEKDVNKVIDEFSKEDIYKFNLDGVENFWSHILANKNDKMDTWAIFWYAIIFKNNGLCLNPVQTFVENIGHDGSGVHCNKNGAFEGELSKKNNVNFNIKIEENSIMLSRTKIFFQNRRSWIRKVMSNLNKIRK